MYWKKAYYMRRVREQSIMTSKQAIQSAFGYYICMTEIENMLDQQEFSRYEMMVVEKFLISLQAAAMRTLDEKTGYNQFWEVLEGFPPKHVMGLILWVYDAQRKVHEREGIVKKENELLKNSISYRLGLFVTYIPRKMYHSGDALIKRMKGMTYKCYQLKQKVSPNKICVSIIIPVYNASKYIRDCIESVLCQSLRNIEIICVNDGSTDNSLEILREYQQKDSRMMVIDQENQGANNARNNGMRYAGGEYLLFLDADDYFDPDLCSLAYYHAVNRRAQICLFKAERLDMKTGRKERMIGVLHEKEIPQKVFSAEDINEKIFQITTACPWSKLFERRFIMRNQLRFQNIKNANDVLFVRTACALAERITCAMEKPFVIYRCNEETSTQGRKSTAPLEFFAAFKELKKQLVQKSVYFNFEKSFVNMLLDECIYNYNTAGTEDARKLVKNTLREEIFPYFGLEKYGRSYYYNELNYET